MSKYSIGLGGRRSNYIHRIHDSRLTRLPFSLDQLLSGYRGASRSASLRPDAHDPPLIRLVVEATRGSVKANTSATFSRSSPFICLLSRFLFLLLVPRFFTLYVRSSFSKFNLYSCSSSWLSSRLRFTSLTRHLLNAYESLRSHAVISCTN